MIVLAALQRRAVLVWLRPNQDNWMIFRYLVINSDLLCNVFKLQSVWILNIRNRYHLAGILVSDDRNYSIYKNRFVILRFQNISSKSSGILSCQKITYSGYIRVNARCMQIQLKVSVHSFFSRIFYSICQGL